MSEFATLDRLMETITARQQQGDSEDSYTASLFKKGRAKIAQKIGEEGVELALAAVKADKIEACNESADLLYHVLVLWADMGISPREVMSILEQREGISGIEEKQNRGKTNDDS